MQDSAMKFQGSELDKVAQLDQAQWLPDHVVIGVDTRLPDNSAAHEALPVCTIDDSCGPANAPAAAQEGAHVPDQGGLPAVEVGVGGSPPERAGAKMDNGPTEITDSINPRKVEPKAMLSRSASGDEKPVPLWEP